MHVQLLSRNVTSNTHVRSSVGSSNEIHSLADSFTAGLGSGERRASET
jgi:hypothetical protein